MKDHFDFDCTPCEEDCAQVGTEGYEGKARREARVFIRQLERVHGGPPEGAQFKIHSNPHDFGSYLTVRLLFENEYAEEYAEGVEGGLPEHWDVEAKVDFQRLEEKSNIRAEERRHANALTEGDIAEFMFDSVVEAADGCQVEPDGTCEHGYRSPLLVMGLI